MSWDEAVEEAERAVEEQDNNTFTIKMIDDSDPKAYLLPAAIILKVFEVDKTGDKVIIQLVNENNPGESDSMLKSLQQIFETDEVYATVQNHFDSVTEFLKQQQHIVIKIRIESDEIQMTISSPFELQINQDNVNGVDEFELEENSNEADNLTHEFGQYLIDLLSRVEVYKGNLSEEQNRYAIRWDAQYTVKLIDDDQKLIIVAGDDCCYSAENNQQLQNNAKHYLSEDNYKIICFEVSQQLVSLQSFINCKKSENEKWSKEEYPKLETNGEIFQFKANNIETTNFLVFSIRSNNNEYQPLNKNSPFEQIKQEQCGFYMMKLLYPQILTKLKVTTMRFNYKMANQFLKERFIFSRDQDTDKYYEQCIKYYIDQLKNKFQEIEVKQSNIKLDNIDLNNLCSNSHFYSMCIAGLHFQYQNSDDVQKTKIKESFQQYYGQEYKENEFNRLANDPIYSSFELNFGNYTNDEDK